MNMDMASTSEACPYCDVIFTEDKNKWNDTNVKRHIDKHETDKNKKLKSAKQSTKRKNTAITNYFASKPKKATSLITLEEANSVNECSENVVTDNRIILDDEFGSEIDISHKEIENVVIDNGAVILDDNHEHRNESEAELSPNIEIEEDELEHCVIPTFDEMSEGTDEKTSTNICSGFTIPSVNGIYSSFPFQILKDTPEIIFENGSFHDEKCCSNNYQLFNANPVNECCSNLNYSTSLNKISQRMANNEIHLSHYPNKFLSFDQLNSRIHNLQGKINAQKLVNVNQLRKNKRLINSMELHQRFLMLINENSIPKLHELVKVALKSKRSMSYIINQVVNAIDGVYNARSSQCDKDLAFLILQFGGPGLLDICHRALNLPSTSTAYQLLKKSKAIISSINTPLKDFSVNIDVDMNKQPRYGFMLKIDETYVDPRVKWNPSDNCIYGVCYEHGRDTNMEFTSYEKISQIASDVRNNKMHVPKESMVIAIGSNSSVSSKAQLVCALPTCSKKEIDFQANLLNSLSSEFYIRYNTPILNWSTDGDPARRQLFNALMSHDLQPSSSIYEIISKLKLIDTKVGFHEETVNFDAKHMIKRIRTYAIKGFSMGTTYISKNDVEKLLQTSTTFDSKHSIKELLNPKDKQNVPLATEFVLEFIKAVSDKNTVKSINFRFTSIYEELELLKYVMEGLLSLYCYVYLDVSSQLQMISKSLHVLLILKRVFPNFIPNQLYHDIQSTFEDSFYCAAKWKVHCPDLPLYLMLLSNDVLETFWKYSIKVSTLYS